MRPYYLCLASVLSLSCGVNPDASPSLGEPYLDEASEELLPDICSQPATAPIAGLSYSGAVAWEASTGRLAFLTSGHFPEGTAANQYREFHYRVSPLVKRIVICDNVRLTGHFVVDHDVLFRGRNRGRSVIYGTDTVDWSHTGGRQLNPWEYSAISGLGSNATISIRNLTIENARSYAVSGRDLRVDLDGVDLIHDRPNDDGGSNSDGVQGASGSRVLNSYFNVGDDAIKLYSDMTVENVVIDLQRNGAPIQLGWDRFGSVSATGTFKNLTINGTSSSNRYNMPILSWVNDEGQGGIKTIDIDGLTVNGLAQAMRWNGAGFEPYPLVVARARTGQIQAQITHARINVGQFGSSTPRGHFDICGSPARGASFSCP